MLVVISDPFESNNLIVVIPRISKFVPLTVTFTVSELPSFILVSARVISVTSAGKLTLKVAVVSSRISLANTFTA